MTIRGEASQNPALRVAVLVTLEQHEAAGGHVKCWERFAEAAAHLTPELDLAVHFLGAKDQVLPISENARFHHHRPILGTRGLSFLKQGAGHTDLAPFHPGLNAALADRDIIHATDFFSFGRTGLRHARRRNKGLVASIHTDAPKFARIYAGDVLKQMTGRKIGNWLVDGFRLPDRIAARMSAGIDRRLQSCHHVLVSKPEDYNRLFNQVGSQRLSYLRRGIDRQRFAPSHRDRAWLQQTFNIPATRTVLMFAGRVDASKNVMVMAHAARHLLDAGQDIHILVVGSGEDQGQIAALLGDRVTMPGNVSQAELAKFYASADLFLFPSTTEVCPNVVIEARASGLPVVVAASHGGAQFIRRPGIDGLIAADQRPETWAAMAGKLLGDADMRQAMSLAARSWAESDWPSWADVLQDDLLGGWYQAADATQSAMVPGGRPGLATRNAKIGWNENGLQ